MMNDVVVFLSDENEGTQQRKEKQSIDEKKKNSFENFQKTKKKKFFSFLLTFSYKTHTL